MQRGQQDCLTAAQMGPARAAECGCIGDQHLKEGDVINPPDNAAAVTIDRLKVKRIIIVEKEPNPFRNGFWDVDLKYVFEYRLTFREADGTLIGSIKANSIFNKKVTLFGSHGTKQRQCANPLPMRFFPLPQQAAALPHQAERPLIILGFLNLELFFTKLRPAPATLPAQPLYQRPSRQRLFLRQSQALCQRPHPSSTQWA